MFGKKKILLSLLVIPFLFACNKPSEKEEKYPHEFSSKLIAEVDSEMDITVNDNLKDRLKVKYDDSELQLIEPNDDITAEGYFFSASNDKPISNRVSNPHISTNAETMTLNFYVCHFVANTNEDKGTVYVSTKYSIVVKNPKALKPWVLWTVGTIVILLCVTMVYFTRRYKEKHG